MGLQNGRLLSEPGTRCNQGVDPAAVLQHVEPTQGGDHPLPHPPLDALVLDKLQVLVLAGLLDPHKHVDPHKHGVLPGHQVSLLNATTNIMTNACHFQTNPETLLAFSDTYGTTFSAQTAENRRKSLILNARIFTHRAQL
jgi:hypothetical protein